MKTVFVGEMAIGPQAIVHGADLAEAMGVPHARTLPKDTRDTKIVVGRLLGGRKPATLLQAEKKGLMIMTVQDMLDQATGKRLLDLLQKKEKLEPYERKAIEALQGAKSQRKGRKSTKVSAT